MPSPAATAPLRTDYQDLAASLLATAPGTGAMPRPTGSGDTDALLRGVAFGLAFVAPFWALVALLLMRIV